jgi:hypothetical protein
MVNFKNNVNAIQALSTTSLAPFIVNVLIYLVFGFANKYLYSFGDVVFFHDDDPLVFKEIKLLPENNGYEIHLRWAVINTLLRMSLDIKGKRVMFYPHSCLDQSIFQIPQYNLFYNFCNANLS